MHLWDALLDVLILLGAAVVLGTIAERLKLSAILGYLLAGVLLGPNALNWMQSHRAVETIAELGVVLLLFSIGLEFSWRRLVRMGPIALGGGSLQVSLTTAIAALVALACGLGGRGALAIGGMIALSSTACVLRVLVDRAEIDSTHGRASLGVLLLQDIAVVPLVLMVTLLGKGGTPGEVTWMIGQSVGAVIAMMVGFYLLFNLVMPRLLNLRTWVKNRELPILLAMVVAMGSAWIAHKLHLSPALGAFIAGMLLAESPFATQLRADVGPVRTILVTLFFSSVGMLSEPAWMAEHWLLLTTVAAAVVVGKGLIVAGIVRIFRRSIGSAVATGASLAQIGEFSFVLASVAVANGVMGDESFRLILSATIVTLFLTPNLVALAPQVAWRVERWLGTGRLLSEETDEEHADLESPILVIGFGPAGQRLTIGLLDSHCDQLIVLDLNPRSVRTAISMGVQGHVGDARRRDVLHHVGVERAQAAIVTLPDPTTCRLVIQNIREMAPRAKILARGRWHVHRWELQLAGSHVVVDEEDHVGLRLAVETRRLLRGEPASDEADMEG